MKVEDRMTRKVFTLTEDQSLRDAIAVMQRNRIRHAPVVSGEKVVGILTDRDVKRASPSALSGIDQAQYDRVLNETRVGQAMTRNPFTVTPSTSIRDAVKVLIDRKYSALPVVEDDRLVGIITGTDMLRLFHETLDE